MKILAADDQPIILKSIEHKLKSVDFTVVTAKDGSEAIKLFDTEKPDLIILDLNMPHTSGFEVLKYIRSTKQNFTPIIVMSGNDDESTIIKAFNLGADDYIEKPVGLNEVVARVRHLLKIPLSEEDLKQDEHIKSAILQKHGVGVVIPCYNEEKRLKMEKFGHFVRNNPGYHVCFVNDGSTDGTLEVLNKFKVGKEGSISVYNCEKNGGKAEAVRLGMLHLANDKSLDYIGFLDADLSTNFDDFDDLTKTIASTNFKIVSGSRISRMGANIIKQSSRGMISKTINFIIRKILGMEFQDTQCGAKIMTRHVIDATFQEPFLTCWLFDIEIFMRMKRYYGVEVAKTMICEQPLKRWVHEDGSKLSMKDSVKILGQLVQIAVKY
ncbi:MAG: CheY-like chemotaxis protein [Spirosomataceae bacterium]|jgi:CheY-like chemotaxis protein